MRDGVGPPYPAPACPFTVLASSWDHRAEVCSAATSSSVSAAGGITGCVCQSWAILHREGKNIHCKPHPEHHWSGRTTFRKQVNQMIYHKVVLTLARVLLNTFALYGWLHVALKHWSQGIDIWFSHLTLHCLSHGERVSAFENILGKAWEERKSAVIKVVHSAGAVWVRWLVPSSRNYLFGLYWHVVLMQLWRVCWSLTSNGPVDKFWSVAIERGKIQ